MTTTALTRKQKRLLRKEGDIVDNKFAMKRITPITEAQAEMFDEYNDGQMIAAIGSAGSGKTYLALYLALKDVLENELHDKVVIIRSAVQTREIGFMPGGPKEKESFYEPPYCEIVNDLFNRTDGYAILKQKGSIQFTSTTFMRGITLNNAVVIFDECQNATYEELRTVITRIGHNSKIIFCGDTKQDDLRNNRNRADVSGLSMFLTVLGQMEDFSVVEFTTDDIVRSGLVREFIITEEKVLEYN